jgi:hypothetical protein
MVRRVLTELTDDLDGARAERTVHFALDGVAYEIDLSKKNSAALTRSLQTYITAGRRVRGVATRGRRSGSGAGRRPDLPVVREWARANGYDIGNRGRIPTEITDAYDAR